MTVFAEFEEKPHAPVRNAFLGLMEVAIWFSMIVAMLALFMVGLGLVVAANGNGLYGLIGIGLSGWLLYLYTKRYESG